jgi:hypothetical protein
MKKNQKKPAAKGNSKTQTLLDISNMMNRLNRPFIFDINRTANDRRLYQTFGLPNDETMRCIICSLLIAVDIAIEGPDIVKLEAFTNMLQDQIDSGELMKLYEKHKNVSSD